MKPVGVLTAALGLLLSTACPFPLETESGSPDVPGKSLGRPLRVFIQVLTGSWTVVGSPVFVSVFPFTVDLRLRSVGYSGSADTLKVEAAQAAFSAPPHVRSVSPAAYGSGGPNIRTA